MNPEDQRYFVSGRQIGEITNNGNGDPALADYAQNINVIRNWTPNQQVAPFRWNTSTGVTRGTFGPSAGYDYINPFGAGAQSAGSAYTVREGETLQSIAANVWGEASLWYLIAEANGLSGSAQLTAGQRLTVPDRVTNARNNAGTFKVYDPNSALGDLSPTTAKPPKKPGACAVIGQILMVVIAVAVTIYTAGALGTVMSPILAGAIGGAAGSVASQAFGLATGLQNKFDWKGVGMAAIGGAVGGAMAPGGLTQAGAFSKVGGSFAQGALRGAVSSMVTQGIGVATGLQDQFSWAGVAGAAVGGGIADHVSSRLGADIKLGRIDANLANGLANGVGAIGNAGVRSLITGTSFGDNLLAALPDVIGSTIGNMIVSGVQGSGSRGTANVPDGEVTVTAQGLQGQGPPPTGDNLHPSEAQQPWETRLDSSQPPGADHDPNYWTSESMTDQARQDLAAQVRAANVARVERGIADHVKELSRERARAAAALRNGDAAALENARAAVNARITALNRLWIDYRAGMVLEHRLIRGSIGQTVPLGSGHNENYVIQGPGHDFGPGQNGIRAAAKDAIVLGFYITDLTNDTAERAATVIETAGGGHRYSGWRVGFLAGNGDPVTVMRTFGSNTAALVHIHPDAHAIYNYNTNTTFRRPYDIIAGQRASQQAGHPVQLFLGGSDGSFRWVANPTIGNQMYPHIQTLESKFYFRVPHL